MQQVDLKFKAQWVLETTHQEISDKKKSAQQQNCLKLISENNKSGIPSLTNKLIWLKLLVFS